MTVTGLNQFRSNYLQLKNDTNSNHFHISQICLKEKNCGIEPSPFWWAKRTLSLIQNGWLLNACSVNGNLANQNRSMCCLNFSKIEM